MQIVFQDPYCLAQPAHDGARHRRRAAAVCTAIANAPSGRGARARPAGAVGLQPRYMQPLPARVLRRPAPAHRHRPGARASSPSLIVCDEPVSALDVSIQAQVINLLRGPAGELRPRPTCSSPTTWRVVEHISDRVAVMYLGKIVEIGADRRRSSSTRCTPTREALLSAVPVPDPTRERDAAHRPRRATSPSPAQPAVGLPLPHPLPPGRRRSARTRSRRSPRSLPATRPPATSPAAEPALNAASDGRMLRCRPPQPAHILASMLRGFGDRRLACGRDPQH